jgi:glycosyltransferase involved in cell wall biosynthesis
MQKQGLADVRFIELKNTTMAEIAKAASTSDFIQAVGLMDMNGIELVQRYQALGVKIATDYDDLHFNCSPWNPKYRQFGTEEVQLEDGSWLWKDGKDNFDLKKNQFKFHTYKKVLQTADVVTTTTLYLKEALAEVSEYQANLRVMPNAVDFDEWKPLDVRSKFKDKFRFGWAVSGSHGDDWIYAKQILIDFLKSHPDAIFVCIGDTYLDIKKGMAEVASQIEWYPWSDLWEGHYQLRLPLLGLDCAIMPLADTEFNRCKSPLKWAEMTAFGWPVVAQDMEPYSSHIQNGQTGLLCKTKEDWILALNQMYSNPELRKRLRFNALLICKQMFDVKEVAKEWQEMYLQILHGETVTK